jgi:hypothetical protein
VIRLVALLVVAAWSIVPPFIAELDVARSVEIVDHVVPGLIATAAAGYAVVERGKPGALIAIGICAVTGLWEMATHFTLVLDAGSAERPVGTVVLHATPGPMMLGLSLWLLLVPPR